MIASGRELTKFNEGLVLAAKPDAKGRWEIGYGHSIPAAPGLVWSREAAETQFETDYQLAERQARADVGADTYDALCDARRAVLTDMAFELGGRGLADFLKLLDDIRARDWNAAALSLRASKLFSQVPHREVRNINILISGKWPL